MVHLPSGSPAFCSTGNFFVAIILYAALTVLWVWILSFNQLSRAYSFLALAFALAPAVCTENPIRVDDVTESPKLAE